MKGIKKIVGLVCMLLCMVVFVACSGGAPKTLNDGFEKMENAGYTVTKMTTDDISETFGGTNLGATAGIVCEQATNEEVLLVLWFDESDKAKDFEGVFNLMKDDLKELVGDVEVEYKQEGKVFYFGTKKAIEAFTK